MRRLYEAAACLICALMLSGCGAVSVPEEVSTPTLVISKDGTVTVYQVGIFDKDYYDIKELEQMAVSVAANYNTAHSTADGADVKVKDVYLVAGEYPKAVVAYSFGDCRSYEDFLRSMELDTTLFYGTVSEAKNAGYDPYSPGELFAASKSEGERIKVTEQPEFKPNDKLIITTDQAVVYCPSQIRYISGQGNPLDRSVADTTLTDGGLTYIYLK